MTGHPGTELIQGSAAGNRRTPTGGSHQPR